MKWSVIERAMAEMSQMLDQGGITSIDWFSDKLFKAFNISMVTKTERAIVMGWGSWKMAQSIPCRKRGGKNECKVLRQIKVAFHHLECFVVGSALQVMAQLIVGQMRADGTDHVPPSSSSNGAGADVGTDSHVTEEEPASDEAFRSAARWLVHDVQIGGIETQGCGRQTVSYQVDPQKLDGNQSFGQAKSGSQENTDNLMIQRVLAVNRNNNNTTSASCVHLSDVGGNEVTDKLFHVVVDGTTLFNGGDNGGEVIISQNHFGSRFGDSSAGAHGDTNFGLFQGRGIVDTITSHGRDFIHALKVLDDL